MRCTECGARYQTLSTRCPECGALQKEISTAVTTPAPPPEATKVLEPIKQAAPAQKQPAPKQPAPRPTRSLINFPGVSRSAVPEWRREVGERVRERLEKRAREAVLETADVGVLVTEPDSQNLPLLELLPQAEIAPVNPLVAKALRRIERANSQPALGTALATVIAYEEPDLDINQIPTLATNLEVARPERIHNLAVVPALDRPSIETRIIEPPAVETPVVTRPTKRVIDELNCPSLNYLDAIPTAVILEVRDYEPAGFFRRVFSAITDLIIIALLSSPGLALVNVTNFTWQDTRVIAFLASMFLLVGFLYLTITIAFTGRTLGMKLLSTRVVDARTGLIPTGSQSAGRSIVFMLSLASAGVVMLYALIDRERHTMHDRFTRTAVIRA